jgi:phosphate/sulfate permease
MIRILFARLGQYIATKPNFLKASVLGFGVPFGVVEALVVRHYGAVAVVVALLLAPIAGYAWGLVMWHLMFKDIYAKRAKTSATPP